MCAADHGGQPHPIAVAVDDTACPSAPPSREMIEELVAHIEAQVHRPWEMWLEQARARRR